VNPILKYIRRCKQIYLHLRFKEFFPLTNSHKCGRLTSLLTIFGILVRSSRRKHINHPNHRGASHKKRVKPCKISLSSPLLLIMGYRHWSVLRDSCEELQDQPLSWKKFRGQLTQVWFIDLFLGITVMFFGSLVIKRSALFFYTWPPRWM
jgi:hypothetical protein